MVGFVLYDIMNKSNNKWYLWGVSLILGGAIGNFIDRIFLGYVRDFISIKFFSFVFNLADLFITIGVICFVIYIIVDCAKDIKNKKEKSSLTSKGRQAFRYVEQFYQVWDEYFWMNPEKGQSLTPTSICWE